MFLLWRSYGLKLYIYLWNFDIRFSQIGNSLIWFPFLAQLVLQFPHRRQRLRSFRHFTKIAIPLFFSLFFQKRKRTCRYCCTLIGQEQLTLPVLLNDFFDLLKASMAQGSYQCIVLKILLKNESLLNLTTYTILFSYEKVAEQYWGRVQNLVGISTGRSSVKNNWLKI